MENNKLASSLRSVISKMTKRLRKHMSAMGSLSISEIDTLSFLYHQETLSPTELAELNKIKGQSMSEVLSRLRGLNMIDKKQSLTDKRKFDVSLTDYGKNIVEQTRYERDEWLSDAIGHHLSETEKAVLAEAVTLMSKIADFQ